MKTIRLAAVLLLLSAASARSAEPAPPHGTVRIVPIHSEALAGNRLGDPADQKFAVYLPPSYAAGAKRYPVVYLLHGIADTYEVWTELWKIPALLDRLIAEKKIGEMIVVMPNGRNRFLGSYYLNSTTTGRWSDYIADEIVGAVDKEFRTIATREGRGIMGHSMGGFGAVHFAMTRSELFSAAYAISPCCLDAVGDIGWGNQAAWIGAMAFHSPADADAALAKGDFYPVAAYGLTAAMIPDASSPTFARMPMKMDHGMAMPSDPVYTAFVDQFPVQQVRAFRDNLKSLRGFGIEYGTSDQFADIPPGVTRFTNALSELRVPYTLDVYDGDHRKKVVERMATIIFPFFSRLLDPAR
jgi:S-formylglutathione hydrolase FrmB